MKILHLEDHALFAESFRVLLTNIQPDTEILTATNTNQALQLLTSDIDLIIADLDMPGVDGQSFIEGVHHRKFVVPIMVLTAMEDCKRIRAAIEGGVSGFATKSQSITEIIHIIDEIIQGNSVIPESIQRIISQGDYGNHQETVKSIRLSKRQSEVLQLIDRGFSNQEISEVLNISANTVKVHVRSLFETLNADNRMECVVSATRLGLIRR